MQRVLFCWRNLITYQSIMINNKIKKLNMLHMAWNSINMEFQFTKKIFHKKSIGLK